MNAFHFDTLARALTDRSRTRRTMMQGLLGSVFAAGAMHLGLDDLEARKRNGKKRKKRKNKKKNQGQAPPPPAPPPPPLPNEFGCLNVGQACQGNSNLCCSGICQGPVPAVGQPDTSSCVAHNAGVCSAQTDSCTLPNPVPCNASNPNCLCILTTGQAGFCGDISDAPDGGDLCRVCARDADCEAEFGPGAACLALDGICAGFCLDTGGTACAPPCA